MSIIYNRFTRRQFLVGTGNTLLTLPLLPSLIPATSQAQTAAENRRMMLFWFDHGNLSTMWPQRSVATTAVGASGAREIMLRNLGTASSISKVFSNTRYEAWKNADQMTILRGFDTAVAYGPAHGNFTLACANDRNSGGNYPTMDTIVEASRTVYPATTQPSVRKAIRVNLLGGTIFYQKVGGTVQPVPNYDSDIARFYSEVFGSLTNGTTAPTPADNTNLTKSNILNKVYGSFTPFKSSRKISSDDLARLDQHMSMISDIQKSFVSAAPMAAAMTCNKPAAPGTNASSPATNNSLYMDLLALAMKCNLTQFATMAFESQDPQWMPNLGLSDMHGAMHGSQGNVNQQRAFDVWWGYFANLIADRFLAPLDVQEGNTGRTYLQNMLTGLLCVGGIGQLGNDNGHAGIDSQQILIGSMGGRLRSGRYYSMPGNNGSGNMPYNTFLITLLQLMGIPAAEYAAATPDGKGFGYYGDFAGNNPLRSRFYDPISEILT